MVNAQKVMENSSSTSATTTAKRRVHITEVEPSRKSNRHLILTTLYAFNNSCSKNAIVSIKVQSDGSCQTIIKIVTSKLQGINLGATTWSKF